MIRNVSFGGIYIIKFPKSCSDEQIQEKYKNLDNYINEKRYMYMQPTLRHNITPQKPGQSASDILLVTSINNSSQIYDALSSVSEETAQQYFDKTKVYLDAIV